MFDVSVVAGLAAAALFLRWLLSSRASGGAFPAISVGSCAVIAVVATLPVVVRANLDNRLGGAASKLIGIPVKVNCQTLTGSALDLGNDLGWVAWGPDGRTGRALYFTRASAPAGDGPLFHHIGLYAFTRPALARFVALPPSPLETREKLEQLRALEAGMAIAVARVDRVPLSVDTPDDLAKANRLLSQDSPT